MDETPSKSPQGLSVFDSPSKSKVQVASPAVGLARAQYEARNWSCGHEKANAYDPMAKLPPQNRDSNNDIFASQQMQNGFSGQGAISNFKFPGNAKNPRFHIKQTSKSNLLAHANGKRSQKQKSKTNSQPPINIQMSILNVNVNLNIEAKVE